jgi:hypothetical protein
MELVVALVMALVMALTKLAAIRRPESLPATFIKVRLRTDYATNIHAGRHSCDMRAFQGARKTPNPSVNDRIYG